MSGEDAASDGADETRADDEDVGDAADETRADDADVGDAVDETRADDADVGDAVDETRADDADVGDAVDGTRADDADAMRAGDAEVIDAADATRADAVNEVRPDEAEAVELAASDAGSDAADAAGSDAADAVSSPEADAEADPLAAMLAEFDAPRPVAPPGVQLSEELPIDPEDDLRTVEGEASLRLVSILESLLFAAAKPLKVQELRKVLAETSQHQIQLALKHLMAATASRGVVLAQVAGGFQFRTHPDNAVWVQKMLQSKPARLSRTQIETLAIVAYRQPITRPEIDDVRGVDSGAVLKTLLERELIQIVGRKEEPGRPLLYGTTVRFLEFFNLRSLRDMPTLRDFRDLSEESKATLRARLGESEAEALGQGVLGLDLSAGVHAQDEAATIVEDAATDVDVATIAEDAATDVDDDEVAPDAAEDAASDVEEVAAVEAELAEDAASELADAELADAPGEAEVAEDATTDVVEDAAPGEAEAAEDATTDAVEDAAPGEAEAEVAEDATTDVVEDAAATPDVEVVDAAEVAEAVTELVVVGREIDDDAADGEAEVVVAEAVASTAGVGVDDVAADDDGRGADAEPDDER